MENGEIGTTNSINSTAPNITPTVGGKTVQKRTFMGMLLKILIAAFVVFVVLVIFTIFSQYKNIKANKAKINAAWPQYRCQPHVMPFTGWLVGPPGVSGVGNFVECGLLIFKNSFARFMTPVLSFLDKLLNVILDLIRSVENIRKMINYLRVSIREFLSDIGSMLYGYGKKISYLFNRLLQTFGLVFDTFYYLFYTLAYAIYTVASIWNSPIGGVARYFGCFPGSTYITMQDGSRKLISHLRIGEQLKDSGKVLAIFQISGKHSKFYSYPGKTDFVFVSGDHLVLEDNRWTRVEDSEQAQETDICDDIIYCLITSSGRICIDGLFFSDFQEVTSDQQIRWIRQQILSSLNNRKEPPIDLSADKIWGLEGDTLIYLPTGERPLREIRVGDQLRDGGYVKGVVEIDGTFVDQFLHKGKVLSGDVLVKEGSEWIPVRCSRAATVGTQKIKKLYHLLTSTNVVPTEVGLLTDFDQTLEERVNTEIDCHVERFLNRKLDKECEVDCNTKKISILQCLRLLI